MTDEDPLLGARAVVSHSLSEAGFSSLMSSQSFLFNYFCQCVFSKDDLCEASLPLVYLGCIEYFGILAVFWSHGSTLHTQRLRFVTCNGSA